MMWLQTIEFKLANFQILVLSIQDLLSYYTQVRIFRWRNDGCRLGESEKGRVGKFLLFSSC
jgi:hypothetical protein